MICAAAAIGLKDKIIYENDVEILFPSTRGARLTMQNITRRKVVENSFLMAVIRKLY